MIPTKNIIARKDYADIPEGVDMGRLEKIYHGLVSRGLPEEDIPVLMSYMISESGADPSREDGYGKGLLDGLDYSDNMFIDDGEDAMFGRQLDAAVKGVLSGDIDTVVPPSSTDYGQAINDRIRGNVDPRDYNSILDGGTGWKFSDGGELKTQDTYWPMQNDDGVEKYYRGSPYELPAIEVGEDGKKRIVGMSDITSSVLGGTNQLLYDDDFMKNHTVYRTDDGRYTLLDNRVIPTLDTESLGKVITSEELRKSMPSMQYIGGDNYRLRVARLIPGFMEDIQRRADSYGVNPNLVLHRMMKEGLLDHITQEFNDSTDEQKSHFFTDGHLWEEGWNGYSSLGIDDAGQNLIDGRYKLKDSSAKWHTADSEFDPTNERGRQIRNVPVAENLQSAVEMMTAELAYRQGVLSRRGIPQQMLDAYTNAAFNAGLNSPILSNPQLVQSSYSVPDWYNSFAGGGDTKDVSNSVFWDPETYLLYPQSEVVIQATAPQSVSISDYDIPLVPEWVQSPSEVQRAEQPNQLVIPDMSQKGQMPEGFVFTAPVNPQQTLLQQIQIPEYQRDNTVISTPTVPVQTLYTPDLAYNEAVALGASENAAIANALKTIPTSDEDVRALQTMLFENNYYDTSKYVPEITARTTDEIKALQRMLKDAGYDLGTYGENKDGIDGKLGRAGSKTRIAWAQYVKDHPDEAMRAHFVDGDFGRESKAAYMRYLKDVQNARQKMQHNDKSLSLQMYESIPVPTRLTGMATTVLPAHFGAWLNKQANNAYGKRIGIDEYDDYIGDTVENAYTNLNKAKHSGNAERIENAIVELEEARRLLRTNKLNRRTMSRAEKEAYMSVLTHLNGEQQMTYEDYLKNIELIGGNDGDFLGTNSKHQHKKIKGKEVMLYGGNSSYSLSNMFEDENELVDTGKKASNTAGAVVSAEKRIYHDPNRGRTGSSSYYIDKDGNIHISDRLEATEEKAQRGKNDSEAYNTARDYFPRGSTGKIEDIITAQEYKRFIERVNRRKAKQNK